MSPNQRRLEADLLSYIGQTFKAERFWPMTARLAQALAPPFEQDEGFDLRVRRSWTRQVAHALNSMRKRGLVVDTRYMPNHHPRWKLR